MKFGILVILALIGSALGAALLLQDSGYVIISFRGYIVEMNVWVLLLSIVLLYLSVRIVLKLFRAPRQLGQAAGRYRAGRAGQRLTRQFFSVDRQF